MAEVKDPTAAITDKRFQEPLAIARAGREKETAKAQELAQAEGAVEQEKQRVAEIESGLQTAAAEKEAGAVRGAREAYQEKLEREPLPEFVPTQDNVQSIASLFSLIGVMGMVAGKGDALRAMHAMNGMLEGHQKGRADLYKQEKSTFEKNFNSMLKKHEEFRKEMEDAVKTAATDRELGYQKAREAAVKAGSNVVKAMIEKFGVAKAYESLVADNQSVEKAYEIYRQEKRAAEQRAATLEAARIRAAEKTTRLDEKALRDIGPALRNIAEQYPAQTVSQLIGASPDDKKRIVGSFRALEESEATADFVARNPRAVGALAVIKNYLKIDAIKSLGRSEDETARAQEQSAGVDRAIDSATQKGIISRDDAEAAKILQKKLFGLALSDVQGSGQRGSVYLDRQFQNLYDQASRQDTLLKIIRERAEENNRNLRTYKLNVERNLSPENFPLYEADTTERFNAYVKERAPAKIATQQDIKDTAKGQRISVDEAKKRLKAAGYQIEGEQ